jgi:tetratricopeptide (TPR) repeat protein
MAKEAAAHRLVPAVVVAALAFLVSAPVTTPAWAQMSVTVFAGTLARDCARAAITGMRDLDSIKTCTLALQSEVMSNRDTAVTYLNRGVLELSRNDLKGAKSDFDRSIRMVPQLGEAYVNRGAVFIAERQFQVALADIERGLSLNSAEPEKAYYNRAIAHENLGNVKQAYLDYTKAAELKPGWDLPLHELTRFQVKTKDGPG